MIRAILFDLGNTLAGYYDLPQFPAILDQCIGGAVQSLRKEGWRSSVSEDELRLRIGAEKHTAKDFAVTPLAGRLARIFDLVAEKDGALIDAACSAFMQPILALGTVYEDSVPTLRALRRAGFTMAIVTNSPWGSPAELWRTEIRRLGLAEHVDAIVCCGDVGWRKPAAPIFQLAMAKLGARPEECVFVGDDPRWDIVGPQALGIEAILIDRSGTQDLKSVPMIRNLTELVSRLCPNGDRRE